MREELQTSMNLLGQLTTFIVKLEAFPDPGEVFDTLICLRDDVRDEQARRCNKRRLVAELEALGESEGAAKCLEHKRAIVGRDAVTLGELEALLARAQVGAALKTAFVADMEAEE
uniref:Uncharacterized protein n=1 Tax=Tanacetum cinerariifolium TaxID=118510 RepID=A0A6L2P1W9_TANCI|nr:hypothetical protein [Tanacetum cinerariifolium]